MTQSNNAKELVFQLSGKDEKWEPFMVGEAKVGMVSWLRQSQSEDGVVFAGLWKHTPEEHPNGMPYGAESNETFYVIEGKAEITDTNGNTILLERGNSYSLKQGYEGTWKTIEAFKKFFIVS
ncbi:cupin domain-containing protein [Salipaludibacillus sp. CF4.18]|uniref:cupin domain-containing protein n=1 Tax=Salipaludibacillus sp. CF4.18 TaxID=3373081 RepID=UPI003EE6A3FB